jgi:hypothetical protein
MAPCIFKEDYVSAASVSGGASGRRALVIILAVIGILGIILGVLYFTSASSLPSFMVGAVHKGHHEARAGVSVVVGILFLIGAWLAARAKPGAASGK